MKVIILLLALLGLVIVLKFWYVIFPLIIIGVYIGWKVAKYFTNERGGKDYV